MRGFTDKGAEYSVTNTSNENSSEMTKAQFKREIFTFLDELRAGDPQFLERFAKETLEMRVSNRLPAAKIYNGDRFSTPLSVISEAVNEWEKRNGLRLIKMSDRVAESTAQRERELEEAIQEKAILDRLIKKNGGQLVRYSFLDRLHSLFDFNKYSEMIRSKDLANNHYAKLNEQVTRHEKEKKLAAEVDHILIHGSNESTDIRAHVAAAILREIGGKF